MNGHIIICGLGHIGFRSFELLHELGFKIAVITDKTSEDWQKKVELSGGLFILGDARSDELLIKAGIQTAAAVLAVTDQDLVNVSIVMDSRRMNAKIKIICRLFDTHLGKHISEAFSVSQIFSTSEIAAPVFCTAMDDASTLAQFSYQGERFVLQESMLRFSVKPVHALVSKSPRFSGVVDWLFRPALSKFHRILSVIVAIICIATAIIKHQMPLSWMDSFYFVTATITTVGYGDFNFASSSPEMKCFGIFLMLIGAASLAILISVVADMFLSERLSGVFGGRPVPRKDHIILVGVGNIGIRIAEQFTNAHSPVVVVENDRIGRFPADVKRKVAVVDGEASAVDTLKKANVATAKAILLVSDDDIGNLSVGLTAQGLNNQIKTVARIFDAELGDKLQKKLAIKKILSVSGIAAPYFVAATMAENVIAAFRWEGSLVILSESSNLHGVAGSRVQGMAKPLYLVAIPWKA